MEFPLRLDGPEPLYRQIYQGLRAAIAEGRLRAGDRVPSSRDLAARLGVSRNVVLLSYAQLEAEGYVSGRVGSGTFVSRELPERLLPGMPFDAQLAARQPGPHARPESRLSAFGRRLLGRAWVEETQGAARWDFTVGRLAASDFPTRAWQRAVREATRHSMPEYGAVEGIEELRHQILRYMVVSRGVEADPEQVLITTGMRQSYDLTLRLLVDPGNDVLVEEPGFPPVRAWTAVHGAKPVPVAVDDEGIRPDLLGEVRGARLGHLTPSHQFPTGAILSLPRRLAVLEWAQRSGCMLFEDDYDAEFQYAVRPIPALQGIAPDGVVYSGSLAKVLSPALRIGYLVVPRALIEAYRLAKRGADRQTSALLQRALACFMADGSFDQHLRRQRVRYRARREALVEALEQTFGSDVRVYGVQAGLQLLICLPALPVQCEPTLVRQAEAAGVRVEAATDCYAARPIHASLLLGFAALSEAMITEGIRRLASVVAEVRRHAGTVSAS